MTVSTAYPTCPGLPPQVTEVQWRQWLTSYGWMVKRSEPAVSFRGLVMELVRAESRGVLPRRRLSDWLAEHDFLHVQLQALQGSTGPHARLDLRLRIDGLHRRLDELERRLRLRAHAFGEDERAAWGALQRRLRALSVRNPHYTGPERRQDSPGADTRSRK